MSWLKKIKSLPFFIRLFYWEYWPFHAIYAPIYPVLFWYCLKARSFFFFGSSNTTIKNGGFLLESKKEIDKLIPERYKPITLFFRYNTTLEKVIDSIRNAHLQYPLIVSLMLGCRVRRLLR